MSENQDKRSVGRVSAKDRVSVYCENFQDFKIQYAENISVGGMYMVVSEQVPVNKEIEFTLQIRDINKEISGKATVVWTKEFFNDDGSACVGLGLKFEELYGDSETFIRDFVEKHVAN